eukprot:TRINITY_DN29365_c0_g1_i1.p1 TRINITY_DN29365_c0_g1~~TRINITY_DN29365_c0_g1_i1.p1  ORF type:complete len:163 (-),score=3.50 TRINITY_DN29365_c0_g1_i1:109-597(-)
MPKREGLTRDIREDLAAMKVCRNQTTKSGNVGEGGRPRSWELATKTSSSQCHYFFTAFFPASPAPDPSPEACAAFFANFSCNALASLSRRCSGVNPSALPPPALALRAAARSRSFSRWLPRVMAYPLCNPTGARNKLQLPFSHRSSLHCICSLLVTTSSTTL